MASSVIEYAKIFVGGFLWDAILTLDVVFTAHLHPFWSGITTASITIISFTMYDRVIGKSGLQKDKLVVLALGSAFGAGVTIALF